MLTAKRFIEKTICKSGETVEYIQDNMWEIHKWTARTFKIRARVVVTSNYDIHPSEAILKLKLKPNARREKIHLPETVIHEAIQKGWLVKETRFMLDGKTPSSIIYRMGPGLYMYNLLLKESVTEEKRLLQKELQLEINKSKNILPKEFLQKIRCFSSQDEDEESWKRERVAKFLHFLIAYLQLKQKQSTMEFKEIGATYYKKIGGSKVFDSYREVFIDRLEKWAEVPVQELGIVSMGRISSLYFAGNLCGEFSTYEIGTVQSITDIALMEDCFRTDAATLWLVENRAVLTRMSKEFNFLKETNSFILGIDGQMSGAHLKFIRMLCEHSHIQKVMIWVDYDQAGQIIAKNAVELIGDIPKTLIGNEGNTFTSFKDYINWAKTVKQAEQEMTLGGVNAWRRMLNQ